MVAKDDLEGKTTHFTGFYTHTISEPKISKPPIVTIQGRQLSCKMQCKCAGEKKSSLEMISSNCAIFCVFVKKDFSYVFVTTNHC